MLSRPRLEEIGLHLRVVKRIDFDEPRKNVGLIESGYTTAKLLVAGKPPDRRFEQPAGEKRRHLTVIVRELHSEVPVITGPWLIGALACQRNLYLPARDQAHEVKGRRGLVPDRLFEIAHVPFVVVSIVAGADDHLGVTRPEHRRQFSRVIGFVGTFSAFESNREG